VTARRNLALALAGLAILAFVMARIGVGAVAKEMKVVCAGLPIIFALSFSRLVLQTCSWSLALRQEGIRSSVGELMFIRLASQGVGYVTILGPIASEPLKISLLRHHGISAATPTLVDTGVYWFSSGLIGVAGCLSAGFLLAGSRHSVTSMAMLGGILIASLLFIARRESPLASLVDALGVRAPRWLRKAGQIDVAIRRFAIQQPSAIRRMFFLDLGCQLLLAGEVAIIFWCLKLPLHLGTLLGLEAASRMIKIAAGWMPARIGADETGVAGAFVAFGLPAASGLVMALARRARDLFGCLIGLMWLAWRQRSAVEAKGEMICKA